MKRSNVLIVLAVALLGFATQISAQPRIGERMPEFSLQSTTGSFYGVEYAKQQVSVLFFVGYN